MGVIAALAPAVTAATLPPLARVAGSKIRTAPDVRDPPVDSTSLGFLRAGIVRGRSWTLPRAGLTEIEPDLEEDPHDRWRTNGVSAVSSCFFLFQLFFV